ncbi:DNA repair protein rad2 [Cladophialophora chaetospira]|uniref:DNA repair protein rad2 n=1 Tax=Cladophialophora chaetospira TaxID=386627 RepID=A0AA38X1R8_9EURO|nr:DNA repair protein rad2 [Cladophialophora chaetospira]
MGVTGLWTVVAPTARPTQLASLNRKRLAVDASIWIYQFLKAVRDKEGNALRNSHVVGFFRRICKLLYFGIKPVFVFDGGAPVLKRETIRRRVRRREGRREDAARTAGKLLAVQVARAAEEEERRRKDGGRRDGEEEELPPEQELVYVEEIGMNQNERQAGRNEKFRKKDQYHLPDLDVSIESMGAPNDPRIMSQAELEEYARHFHSGEDINLYDFSKIDFESPFFMSLPPGDRYNILNAARLRSRLRMGYSKEQLDGMFPDRMAFSKFQIERVKERNELTQRLMHLNGMVEGDFLLDGGGRIAGEKGKEYILVKNEGVEGGWALGVVSNKQGTKKENAIDLDKDENSDDDANRADSDEDEFEDVAIEGLNRIPKNWARKRKAGADYDMSYDDVAEQIAKKRKAVYEARKAAADEQVQAPLPMRSAGSNALNTITATNNESLFVPDDKAVDEDDDDLFEDVLPVLPDMEEDDDLQRAIAMSLEQPTEADPAAGGFTTETVANPPLDSSDEDEGFDLQAALAESRRSKPKSKTNVREKSPSKPSVSTSAFAGPLPFESLNLGQSLLGKKKSKKIEEDLSGGFDRSLGEDAFRKEKPPQPMPDWFNATPNPKDMKYTGSDRAEDDDHITYGEEDVDRRQFLRRHPTKEVVDLDADEEKGRSHQPIDLEAEDDKVDQDHPIDLDQDGDDAKAFEAPVPTSQELLAEPALSSQPESIEPHKIEDPEKLKRDEAREQRYEMARTIAAENGNGEPEDQPQPKLGKVADEVRAEPPLPSDVPQFNPEPVTAESALVAKVADESDFDEVDWSESDHEQPVQPATPGSLGTVDSKSPQPRSRSVIERDDDEGEDFEDVDMEPAASVSPQRASLSAPPTTQDRSSVNPATTAPEPAQEEEYDYLSSDEEELMRQLAEEAEEHARFTSALNNQSTSTEQAMRDFDAELKALRSQQKRDRRDADEVTQTMIQECQSLLRHFGLPYITAPMEAEAQCAELVRLGLVDGIVTDDSDIFLFGGTRIYKNMFNAAKYVECYLSSDLEKEFLLTREKLVHFAHLLGSDYTEGIPGVGPVTALEILSDFSDLSEFKTWTERVQLGRPSDLENQLTTPFRRKFRKTVQKKIFLPPHFPDERVDEAYLYPEVDANAEPFQWGVPDLDRLRAFLMVTIGWSQERTDEVLVPVVRDINRREVEGTQSNITRYFQGSVGAGAAGGGLGGVRGKALATGGDAPGFGRAQAEAMAPRNRTGKESGRMRNAFKRLRGKAQKRKRNDDDDDEGEDGVEGLGEIQDIEVDGSAAVATATATPTASVSVDGDEDDDGDVAGDEAPATKTKATSRSKAKLKGTTKTKAQTGKTTKRGRRKQTVEDDE